jgi:hypothetical protein
VSSPPPVQPTPLPFSPLFTLLASTSHPSNRQTIQYPTVHYIFADDDPEILTAALARHQEGAGAGAGAGADADTGDDDPENEADAPPDRAVLLDMERTADGSGVDVVWASSLTSDWAVASACVSRVEGSSSGGGGGGAAVGPAGHQVLKIEGVSIEPSSSGPLPLGDAEMQSSGGSAGTSTGAGRQPASPPAPEDYTELLQEFEKRMATLRKVVEAAGARHRALGEESGHPVSEATVVGHVQAAEVFRPETGVGEDAQPRGGER